MPSSIRPSLTTAPTPTRVEVKALHDIMERLADLYCRASQHRAAATFDDRLWLELAKETSDDTKTLWGAFNACRFVNRESTPASHLFHTRQIRPFYQRLRRFGRLLQLWIFDERLASLMARVENRLQRNLLTAQTIAPDLADVWIALRGRSHVREGELQALATTLAKRRATLSTNWAPRGNATSAHGEVQPS
jgi:hypothetical protein